MAIVINGSGTVTGLSVGGLPDGTVDSDTLANNAVVTGKIADGTIANADINDLAASKLTGALPAISGAALTGIDEEGVTISDTWEMSTDFNATSITPIVNWSAGDGICVANKGTAMSHSSGVFTFPTTGTWLVSASPQIYKAGDCRQMEFRIQTSNNGGNSWHTVCTVDMNTNQGSEGSNVHAGNFAQIIFNCYSTSDAKVRFTGQGTSQVTWYGNGGRFLASFTRLGDA